MISGVIMLGNLLCIVGELGWMGSRVASLVIISLPETYIG